MENTVLEIKKVGTRKSKFGDYDVDISGLMGRYVQYGLPQEYEDVYPGKYYVFHLLNDIVMLILCLDTGDFSSKHTYAVKLGNLMKVVPNVRVILELSKEQT